MARVESSPRCIIRGRSVSPGKRSRCQETKSLVPIARVEYKLEMRPKPAQTAAQEIYCPHIESCARRSAGAGVELPVTLWYTIRASGGLRQIPFRENSQEPRGVSFDVSARNGPRAVLELQNNKV
eukprot:2778334-Prymnesium_polylepis.1